MSLRDELGPYGVRVNVVAPGHIWSGGLRQHYEDVAKRYKRSYERELAPWVNEMAPRRIVTPEEAALAIVFLASERSSDITGAVLDVNAGHRIMFHAGGLSPCPPEYP